MSALMTVPFHGANLMLVEHEGQPYVPMKSIISGIGLDWGGQQSKLAKNADRWRYRLIPIPSQGGMQEAGCLPLRKLPGWLQSVSAAKVAPDVRERLIEYQDECDEVLWQYWNEGHAKNPRAAVDPINDPVIPPERQLTVAAGNFDAARRIVQGFGLEGNQVTISANRMVKEAIGIDLMELAGVKRLVNEGQELNYLPGELGAKFGMTANQMNKLLADCGLQRHWEYKPKKKRWEVLPEGKQFAVITDTSKRYSDGKPVQQILWKESVLGELKKLAHRLEAELPKRANGDI